MDLPLVAVGTGRVQESGRWINVRSARSDPATRRTLPGAQPDDSANHPGIVCRRHFLERALGAGAMCHGVLPRWREVWRGSDLADQHRYVDFSIRHLARQFDALGPRRKELEVKVFGGADVLPVMASRVGHSDGRRAELQGGVRGSGGGGLQGAGFRPARSPGPEIHFHTGTGEVMVHRFGSWVSVDPDTEKVKKREVYDVSRRFAFWLWTIPRWFARR